MKKQLISTLSICALSIVLTTGCQKGTYEELVTTSGEAETTTHIVEVETTTGEPETAEKYYLPIEDGKEELAQIYDSERINIKEWTYLDNGWAPRVVEIDGIDYTYGWNEQMCITTIAGNDGSEIIREYVMDDKLMQPVLDKEYKNGECIDYIRGASTDYTGFLYGGRNYTYIFDNYTIVGIKNEKGDMVAEYEYYDDNNRVGIETINHTDEKIGYVNSLKYCCNYITNDMGFEIGLISPIQWHSREYKDTLTVKTVGVKIYLPDRLYGPTSPEEETTTSEPQDESNYDNERIKVTKWDMTQAGIRMPLRIVVNDIEYEYDYDVSDDSTFSIKGSDGTSIKLMFGAEYSEENKNGRMVKYFYKRFMYPDVDYSGFEYEGKKYTYQYGKDVYITGILDGDNKLVAEYKYIQGDKGDKIEVINYTEDNIGDVNSVRFNSQYYDEITGFVIMGEAYNIVNGELQSLKG